MNNTDFDSLLPSLSCTPADTFKVITKRFGLFCHKNLFESEQFVQGFYQRIMHIIGGLPEIKEGTRIGMEKELAIILHQLQTHFGIIISQSDEDLHLRALELHLDRAGVLKEFLDFARGKNDAILLDNEPLVMEFLEYLSLFVKNSSKDTVIYLEMLLRLSQVSEQGFELALEHILKQIAKFPGDIIQRTVKQNGGYFGKEFDKIVDAFMEKQANPKDWRLAETTALKYQNHLAGIHLFLDGIYQAYILPEIKTIQKKELYRIHGILNNLRDILDLDAHIPLYFHTGNIGEFPEVERARNEGRNIH